MTAHLVPVQELEALPRRAESEAVFSWIGPAFSVDADSPYKTGATRVCRNNFRNVTTTVLPASPQFLARNQSMISRAMIVEG
jgi:hypothetical protein